jgi:hypothetical protein
VTKYEGKKMPWYGWRDLPDHLPRPELLQRLYLGAETCELSLPEKKFTKDCCQKVIDAGYDITIVTSLMSYRTFDRHLDLVEYLSGCHSALEVVCNDWGFLHAVRERFDGELILGRLLAHQCTDPRLATFDRPDLQRPLERDIPHVDGFPVRLTYHRPDPILLAHHRQTSIDCHEMLDLFRSFGVRRFEISNLLQGVEIHAADDFCVSLHLPEVLVAMARDCSLFFPRMSCDQVGCRCTDRKQIGQEGFPVPLYSTGNAVYYNNHTMPQDLAARRIDRLIQRCRSTERR